MSEVNFADEEQLYLEEIQYLFEYALRLLWERGEHDQRENDLDKEWKRLNPVLEAAFKKARQYDSLSGSVTK